MFFSYTFRISCPAVHCLISQSLQPVLWQLQTLLWTLRMKKKMMMIIEMIQNWMIGNPGHLNPSPLSIFVSEES